MTRIVPFLLLGLVLAAPPASAAVVQRDQIIASDAAANEYFGISTALSGDILAVSANSRNSSTGAVYIHERNLGGPDAWGERAILTASDATAGFSFGLWTALEGDTLATTSAPRNSNTGAVYVFKRNSGTGAWSEVKIIVPADIVAGDLFGSSIALSGDTLIVGASTLSSAAGAAYIFERNSGGTENWGQTRKITATGLAAGDRFGLAVGVSGNLAIVGAPNTSGPGSNAGAAYVFQRNLGGSNNWGQVKKLTAPDAAVSNFFGDSVGLSGDTAVIGAYGRSPGGAAYVFQRNSGGSNNWGNTAQANGSSGIALGRPVVIDTDTIVAGAISLDGNRGGAQVFRRVPAGTGTWTAAEGLVAADRAAGDFFGHGVAVSGNTFSAGAPFRDGARGAVYIFAEAPPATELDSGGGSMGGAGLVLLVLLAGLRLSSARATPSDADS